MHQCAKKIPPWETSNTFGLVTWHTWVKEKISMMQLKLRKWLAYWMRVICALYIINHHYYSCRCANPSYIHVAYIAFQFNWTVSCFNSAALLQPQASPICPRKDEARWGVVGKERKPGGHKPVQFSRLWAASDGKTKKGHLGWVGGRWKADEAGSGKDEERSRGERRKAVGGSSWREKGRTQRQWGSFG